MISNINEIAIYFQVKIALLKIICGKQNRSTFKKYKGGYKVLKNHKNSPLDDLSLVQFCCFYVICINLSFFNDFDFSSVYITHRRKY